MFNVHIQGDFFTGTPQFQPPNSQSRPFLVTGFTGTAAVIGNLAVFFLVLKLGGSREKITLYVQNISENLEVPHNIPVSERLN